MKCYSCLWSCQTFQLFQKFGGLGGFVGCSLPSCPFSDKKSWFSGKLPFKWKETNIGVTHFSLPWLWDLWHLKHYGHLRVLTISRYDPQYLEEMCLTQIRPKRQKKAKQKSANRCRWTMLENKKLQKLRTSTAKMVRSPNTLQVATLR